MERNGTEKLEITYRTSIVDMAQTGMMILCKSKMMHYQTNWPINSFLIRFLSWRSSQAHRMQLMKAIRVVLYGGSSQVFSSLMIREKRYLICFIVCRVSIRIWDKLGYKSWWNESTRPTSICLVDGVIWCIYVRKTEDDMVYRNKADKKKRGCI